MVGEFDGRVEGEMLSVDSTVGLSDLDGAILGNMDSDGLTDPEGDGLGFCDCDGWNEAVGASDKLSEGAIDVEGTIDLDGAAYWSCEGVKVGSLEVGNGTGAFFE